MINRRGFFTFLAALGFGSGVSTAKISPEPQWVPAMDASVRELHAQALFGETERQGKSVIGYVLDCVSMEKDEPGYRETCTAHTDGYLIRVYLDGVYQLHCEAANVKEGWVRRAVISPESGDMVFDRTRGEVLRETVYGFVTIEATKEEPPTGIKKYRSADGGVRVSAEV